MKMCAGHDHSYFVHKPEETVKTNNGYSCSSCLKCFAHRGSLYNHLKRVHKISNIGLRTVKCLEENCCESFKTTSKLMLHLTREHSKTFILEELKFDSFDDFKVWKRAIEKDTKADYIWYVQNATSDDTLIYYKCSRSGFYKEKPAPQERKRRLKSQGSKKSGAHCTSKLIVKIDKVTKTVSVKFYRTHYGHEMELVHVRNYQG